MKSNYLYRLAIIEIISIIVIYYLIAWEIAPYFLEPRFWQIVIVWISVIVGGYYVFYLSPKLHSESLSIRGVGDRKTLFIKTDNLYSSASAYLVFVLVAALIFMIMLYLKYGNNWSEINPEGFWTKYFFYLVSATVQDLIFFSFIFVKLKFLIKSSFSDQYRIKLLTVTIFAIFFSLFHYPNMPLMFLTYFFAFGLGWIFYLKPNLFWVIMIHALAGVMLHRIYGLHMKIGILYGFHSSDASFFRKIIPGVEAFIGNSW